MRRNQRGSMTLWSVGILLAVLCFVGLVVDFSRLVAADRALATATDAAAAAGANGIDLARYRRTNDVVLDPSSARSLATDAMDAEPEAADLSAFDVAVAPDAVTVRSAMTVHLSLLRLVVDHDLEVRATSTASPRRAP